MFDCYNVIDEATRTGNDATRFGAKDPGSRCGTENPFHGVRGAARFISATAAA
jgi:hypothetical protein